MRMLFAAAAVAGFAFSALPAFAADLEVENAFLRASPMMADVGAGFMVIKNKGKEDDRLVSAAADISKTVELHTHVRDGDVMKMRRVDAINVPAGGEALLQPGGDHVMFIGLHKPLVKGETVKVTLTFAKGGTVVVDAPVVEMGAMMRHGHQPRHHAR